MAAQGGQGEISTRPRLWRERWAGAASAHADAIEHDMEVALACADAPLDGQKQAVRKAVDKMLTAARSATRRGRWPWRSLGDRWSGTSIEWAYYNIHAAKIRVVDVLQEEQVDALLPSAVARVSASLQPTDLRRLSIEQLLKQDGQNTLTLPQKKAGLKQALEIGYDATDQQHTRIRAFRNILVEVAVAIALFVTLLVAVVYRAPEAVPLCFSPSVTSQQAAQSGPAASQLVRRVCPSGENAVPVPSAQQRGPHKFDMVIVAGLGLLGGALAAAFAVRKVRGTSIPYDVPLAVALLKVPTGALTAVTGMLLLGGGFVPGLSELDSQRQILAYALLFGYSQQLGTQFIDRQAQDLLNAVASKDSKGQEPAQPVPKPPAIVAPAGPAGTSAGATSDRQLAGARN